MQKEFEKFHEGIKLKKYDENADLRNKRDLLLNALSDAIKDEKIPGTETKLTFRWINQGSYAMNTGIKPKKEDYDIDVGVIFNVTNNEYNSDALKKLVRDKLNKGNRTVKYQRPCITVDYINEAYHIDLAIYAENNKDIHIAWGKEFSEEKVWYKAEPEELTTWVANVSTDPDKATQFRRCVRYLKKWKEKHFSSGGNYAPPSIGLTIQAREAFSLILSGSTDLNALITIVSKIKNSFSTEYDPVTSEWKKKIVVCLPVQPFKNVYYKMTLAQQHNFYEKVEAIEEALIKAKNEVSEHETSKILRKIFGDEFPLVEDIKETRIAPAIITGHNA